MEPPITLNVQDITSDIVFINQQLATDTEIIEQRTDLIFKYTNYHFTIAWAVDYLKLLEEGITFGGGDYFVFTVPDTFKNLSFNLTNAGQIWGQVTVDANGNGLVTFTDLIEGLTAVNGTLKLSARYIENLSGVPVFWEFKFGTTITTYSGTSEGINYNNVYLTNDNRKVGTHSTTDLDCYFWQLYLNYNQQRWVGSVTIYDVLGDFYRVRNLPEGINTKIYGYYGLTHYDVPNYFGTTSATPYHFAIVIIDWNKMRVDYNALIRANQLAGNTTIHYLDKSGNDVNSFYLMTEEITEGTTGFMRDVMNVFTDQNNEFLYMSPYLGGLVDILFLDDRFVLVFPENAFYETALRIRYYSQITSPVTPATLSNSVEVIGEGREYHEAALVAVAGSGEIFGELGKIDIYKYDSGGRNPLANVEFSLQLIDGLIEGPYPTDQFGHLVFSLVSSGTEGYAGVYTLREAEPAPNYQPFDPLLIEIDQQGLIIRINDTVITGDPDGTTVYEGVRKLCWVSTDQLAIVIYNYRIPVINVYLEGRKQLMGKELLDNEFHFRVLDFNNNTVATGTSDLAGTIHFTPLTYYDVGVYPYRIEEIPGINSNIIYDTTVYPVVITITENGLEEFNADINYPEGEVLFHNTYHHSDPPEKECHIRCRYRYRRQKFPVNCRHCQKK